MNRPEQFVSIVLAAVTSPLWFPAVVIVLITCGVLSIIWPEEEQ